jgi:hypothetical protein
MSMNLNSKSQLFESIPENLRPSALFLPVNKETHYDTDEEELKRIGRSDSGDSCGENRVLYNSSLRIPGIVIPENRIKTPRASKTPVALLNKQVKRTASPTDFLNASRVTPRELLTNRMKAVTPRLSKDYQI